MSQHIPQMDSYEATGWDARMNAARGLIVQDCPYPAGTQAYDAWTRGYALAELHLRKARGVKRWSGLVRQQQ